jgi:hypothetical protein
MLSVIRHNPLSDLDLCRNAAQSQGFPERQKQQQGIVQRKKQRALSQHGQSRFAQFDTLATQQEKSGELAARLG